MNASNYRPTRLLFAALVLGILAHLLFYGHDLGINLPLFVVLGLVMLAVTRVHAGLSVAASRWWPGIAALGFAIAFAWRSAEWLQGFNVLATIGLLSLFAVNFGALPWLRQPTERALARLASGWSDLGVGAASPLVGVVRSVGPVRLPLRILGPVGIGLILAVPVVAVFTGLLASADAVFAGIIDRIISLQLPFDLGAAIPHLFVIGAASWVCAGGLLLAVRGDGRTAFSSVIGELASDCIGLVYRARTALPAEGGTDRLRDTRAPLSLGPIETLTLLGAVNALFVSFVAIQGAYLFGGLATLERTGMTYAEYARRGFFELVTVAVLTLMLLSTLAVLCRRETPRARRGFLVASGLLIVCVLIMLVSAFLRMQLYEEAYGYTQLRLYVQSFMLWIAIALGLLFVAVWRGAPRLFVSGGLIAGLTVLAALNAINPDALIVQENISRFQRGHELDTNYLLEISADALPELRRQLPQLADPQRIAVETAINWHEYTLSKQACTSNWQSWHATWLQRGTSYSCTNLPERWLEPNPYS